MLCMCSGLHSLSHIYATPGIPQVLILVLVSALRLDNFHLVQLSLRLDSSDESSSEDDSETENMTGKSKSTPCKTCLL